MPPRRTSTRAASATPARNLSPTRRSTRGGSVLSPGSTVNKRVLRSNSPANGNVANPNLPEIQIQQSYAYGSSKTPLLPDQLKANAKMTLKQMADTLDSGMRQAEQHIQNHGIEAEARLSSAQDARGQRARRRASRSDSHSSREESVDSQTQKIQRVEAWASSLDNSELENIPEEPAEVESEDDETRRGTDPSSFPSGIYDHSYNYERGLRTPQHTSDHRGIFHAVWEQFRGSARKVSSQFRSAMTRTNDFIGSFLTRVGSFVTAVPRKALSPKAATLWKSLFTLAFAFAMLCAAICLVFKTTVCDVDSMSDFQLMLQDYCGSCVTLSMPQRMPQNLTIKNRQDVVRLSTNLNEITRKVRELETRLSSKLASHDKRLTTLLHNLQKQERDLQTKILDFEGHSPSSMQPFQLMQQVNYFSPGSGAVVNPYLTSPTKQRLFPFHQRLVHRAIGVRKYQSNPPAAALEPWEDLGDCWCSSDTFSGTRLGITMGQLIYPTELVVEHYPSGGSVRPDTAPQVIEVWAEFNHLPQRDRVSHKIDAMQGPNPLSATMAKIGTARFDARPGVNHIQTFKLDINQIDRTLSTKEITLRVVKNHGAEHTCLYRVRMHGVPVVPHPKIQLASDA